MNSGRVEYACYQDVHVMRFIGDIRCPSAPAVARFFTSLMATRQPRRLLIDLTETALIDSTHLGQLVRFAGAMQASGGERVTLLSTREDITVVLMSMGFDQVFTLVEHSESPPAEALTPVDTTASAHDDDLAEVVLAAHRALMALNQHNHDTFSDMVALLEQQSSGGVDTPVP